MSGVVRHLVVALAAGLLLTGCGQMADRAAESMIEGATGADVDMSDGSMTIRDGDSEVTIDTDGQSLTITDESGTSTFQAGEGVELPAAYPSDLPTPSGGVLTTVTDTPDGLMAVWEFDRITEADFDQFTAEIQRAGYAAEGDTLALDSGSDMSRIANFSGNGKAVMVTATGSDESGQMTVLITQSRE
jgi:hypothetical protein